MTSRGKSRCRRGLAILAWGFTFFALAQLVGGLGLDYLWPAVRFPSFGQVLRHWRARRRTPDILFIGSSRFGAGVMPAVMRGAFRSVLGDDCRIDAFNASVPGGDPISQAYEFNRLAQHRRRPGMLVLEISPDMLNAYNEWLAAHVSRQLRWEDVPAYLVDVWKSRQITRLVGARVFPLFVHREEIYRRLARLGDLPAENDDSDQVIDWKQMLQTPSQPAEADGQNTLPVPATIGFQKKLHGYRIGGSTAAALERLLDRCHHLNIPVVLVGVPLTSYARQCFTPEIDAAYHDYTARLCRTYSCRFVDWRDQIPDADFLDIHHMLAVGGEEFSWRLAREVIAPAWRETHSGASLTTAQSASP